MSTYNPEVKLYYGELDNNDHKLIPVPNISISIEYNYSNDTIIGYSYIFNLTGYATALDLRDLNNNDTIPSNPNYNSGAVVDQIHKIRKILSQNGSILHIVDNQNNYILKAKGGILRSFNIQESPNNWIHFANYTASIEFHSVDFGSKTEDCDTIFLDPTTYNTDGILDINKFKIKSFNDGWSISFDENEAFARVKNNENNVNINIDNHNFNIEYTISAVGKHFFTYTDESTSQSNLLPAWEQAKNFVQYRLYHQVTNLINNILKDSYNSACSSSDGLDDILQPGGGNGLLKGLTNYKIFNEQITCETSESEGSFSATYSAIVKSTRGNSGWTLPETKHLINKSTSTTINNTGSQTRTISVNGTIQGLIEGGLIRINEPIRLPENGSIFINNNPTNNKYNNAKKLLDIIYSESDYGGGLGENGKRDLKPNFKNALNITLSSLGMTQNSNDSIPDPPHPATFNLTHNYNDGIITYSVEYSNNAGGPCGKKFTEISVQTTNPVKVSAIFNIPNSFNCPLVQELGTYTNKTVNLTISGIDTSEAGQPTNLDIVSVIINNLNNSCYETGYFPSNVVIPINGIITQQQYTTNPLDGSFTINMTYICNDSCSI
jgi:hypothetical protein